MATWGTEPFENDDASDWATELEEGDLRAQLFAAVGAAADWPVDDVLDIWDGSSAVAAAQVIAHLLGKEPLTHTAKLARVLEKKAFTPDGELVQEALLALDRVQDAESELQSYWAESKDYAQWQAVVARIRGALATEGGEKG